MPSSVQVRGCNAPVKRRAQSSRVPNRPRRYQESACDTPKKACHVTPADTRNASCGVSRLQRHEYAKPASRIGAGMKHSYVRLRFECCGLEELSDGERKPAVDTISCTKTGAYISPPADLIGQKLPSNPSPTIKRNSESGRAHSRSTERISRTTARVRCLVSLLWSVAGVKKSSSLTI